VQRLKFMRNTEPAAGCPHEPSLAGGRGCDLFARWRGGRHSGKFRRGNPDRVERSPDQQPDDE
jgi:hypothetical protein